jgi:sarcosine oxidase subunit gamma
VRGSAPEMPAFQLGPDEWLVVGTSGEEGALAARLVAERNQVVDLTASRTVIELTGPGAGDLLSKGCSLDLHPRAFPPGRCAATLLARTGVILHLVDAAPTWRVFVRASYARYLRDWLTAAAAID